MYDIIVVGAGPSGMTSALYSLRAGKTVLVLESDTFGGQIAMSPRVENFPSIKEIAGSEFSDNLFAQITDLGADIELEKVEKIEKENNIFTVTTDYNSYQAKSVILATGVKHRTIGVDREEELIGKGVSYCAVCDGAFYNDEEVALIGDANTALQYAILLSNYCKKVTVCTLFDKFFGDKCLVETLQEKGNVEIFHNLKLQKFVGENELNGLIFKNTQTQEIKNLDCKAVFIAIGQIPSNSAFESLVQLDNNGYIVANENCTTKTAGLFVAGDCRTKKIRQLTTATADGATASVFACSYIDNLD